MAKTTQRVETYKEKLSFKEWLQLVILGKDIQRVSDGTITTFYVWSKPHQKLLPCEVPVGTIVPYVLCLHTAITNMNGYGL